MEGFLSSRLRSSRGAQAIFSHIPHHAGWNVLCVLLAFALAAAMLAACKSKTSQKELAAKKLSGAFSCMATINVDGAAYVVKIDRSAPGICTMSFLKPAELSPMSLELTANGLKVKYGLFEASVDPSSLPQTAIFNAVLGAFDASASPGSLRAVRASGGGLSLSGKTQAGSFTLVLDPDLVPLSLTLEGLKMSVKFSDFQFVASSSGEPAA